MIGFFGLVLMFIQLSVPFRGFYLCFCFIFIGHLDILSEKACVGSSEPFLQNYNLIYEQFYVVLSQLTSTGERVFNSFKLDIIIIKIQPGISCKMQHFDASHHIIYILMGNFTNHMLASAHQEKIFKGCFICSCQLKLFEITHIASEPRKAVNCFLFFDNLDCMQPT